MEEPCPLKASGRLADLECVDKDFFVPGQLGSASDFTAITHDKNTNYDIIELECEFFVSIQIYVVDHDEGQVVAGFTTGGASR